MFAHLPEPGRVKPRLTAELGEERALAVYEAMLRDLFSAIGSSTRQNEIEVLWAPSRHAGGNALRAAFGHHSTALQTGATLGDRLSMAFSERFFFHCTEKIVAIGTEDPYVDRSLLEHAFALLDSCEYVIGPATAGGYYLVGCRALSFDPGVFRGVDWGTPNVLDQTLRAIASIGRTFALLPQHEEIRTAGDLERFAHEGHEGELASLLRR